MSNLPLAVKLEIEEIAVEALEEFIEDEGIDYATGVELLADTIDALLPLGALVKGPLGASLERGDGPAVEAFLRAIIPLLKPNPTMILARSLRAAKKGRKKRAERLRKRAKRIMERRDGEAESKLQD